MNEQLPSWFWPAVGGAAVTLPIAILGNLLTQGVQRSLVSILRSGAGLQVGLAADTVVRLQYRQLHPHLFVLEGLVRFALFVMLDLLSLVTILIVRLSDPPPPFAEVARIAATVALFAGFFFLFGLLMIFRQALNADRIIERLRGRYGQHPRFAKAIRTGQDSLGFNPEG